MTLVWILIAGFVAVCAFYAGASIGYNEGYEEGYKEGKNDDTKR